MLLIFALARGDKFVKFIHLKARPQVQNLILTSFSPLLCLFCSSQSAAVFWEHVDNTLINEGCLTYHLLARAMPVRGPVLLRYLCAHSLTYILYISIPAQDLDSKAMRNRERKEREQIEDKAEGTKLPTSTLYRICR